MKYSKITFCSLIFAFFIACSATDGGKNEQIDKTKNVLSENNTKIMSPDSVDASNTTLSPTASNATVSPITTITQTTDMPSKSKTEATTNLPVTSTAEIVSSTLQTSPAPSPAPAVENIWAVSNKSSNEYCILMRSKVELQVTYFKATGKMENTTISVPQHVNVSGSCNNSSQNLVVEWLVLKNLTDQVEFTFNKTKDGCYYVLSGVKTKIYLNVTNQDNSTSVEQFNLTFSGAELSGHEGYSHTCTNPSALKLNGTLNSTGELHLSSLQYEAFAHEKDKKFSASIDCISTETPDIVPILVAGALILLVVLVLAAYVITRRRSQARGYLSM